MEELEEQNQTICADCGRVIEEGQNRYGYNGDIICERCFDNSYFHCDICGIVEHIDNATHTRDGQYICDNCRDDNYEYCEDCGEWVESDETVYVERLGTICQNCYESGNYGQCFNCDNIFHTDDLNYDEGTEKYYCDNCYDEDDNDDVELYGYHSFSDWLLYKGQNEDKPPFYIGYELEIQPKDGYGKTKSALHYIYENLNAICARDGSLGSGGIEIISHPQSFQYIQEHKEDMQKVFDYLISLGYTSHDNNTCGLHFHITRPENPDVIDRLWLILETYKKEIFTLSRRTSSQISRWAQFLSDAISNDKEKLKALYFIKKTNKNVSRYMALNNENRKTIEFRFFKGSLKFSTFMADLEFINNLMTLCGNINMPVEEITWSKLCEGEFIKAHVIERGIYANFAPVDKSLQIIKRENAEKTIINRIMRILKQKARELIQAEHITKTNLKSIDDFKRKARELAGYYSDLNNAYMEFLLYVENDINYFHINDFIDRLEYHLNNYNFIKGDEKEKIKILLLELKKIESEEI